MGQHPHVLIVGGSGTFGRLLAREILAHTSWSVRLAGRNEATLRHTRRGLGYPQRTGIVAMDVRSTDAMRRAALDVDAVVCAAGPFQVLDQDIVAAVIDGGAHWFDVADDPIWISRLRGNRELHADARQSGVAVETGMSTTPAVSSALIFACLENLPTAKSALVTLFVGNRNPKGAALISSALKSHWGAAYAVALPRFGRRTAFELPSADRNVVSDRLDTVTFGVAPEWKFAGHGLRWLSKWTHGVDFRARLLHQLVRPLGRFGSTLGSITVEVSDGPNSARAAVIGGQRLAVIPCLIALDRVVGRARLPQPMFAWLAADPQGFLRQVAAAGLEVVSPHIELDQ